jgi:hypothetical protein
MALSPSFRKGCNQPCQPRYTPEITSYSPALGLVITDPSALDFTLVFSQPMNPAFMTASNIGLFTYPGLVATALINFALSADGLTLTFSTTAGLINGTYILILSDNLKAADTLLRSKCQGGSQAVRRGCSFPGQSWTISVNIQ